MGELIRPFCIMRLYQYLLHYGVLLHIMSQYLCLFSLILQGLHEERECRQLEFWAGKGANIRDMYYTSRKVLKLHGNYFSEYIKNIGRKKYERGPTNHPRGWGRALPPWARPLPHGHPGSPPVTIFCYMKSFTLEKIISKLMVQNSAATRRN